VHCDAVFTRDALQAVDTAGANDYLVTMAPERNGNRRSEA
jgi:hypothetical protein